MRRILALTGLLLAVAAAAGADKVDPLTLARILYNQQDYAGALTAAEEARRLAPARADSADLIAARAYLERFSRSLDTDTTDLTNARDRLRRLGDAFSGLRPGILRCFLGGESAGRIARPTCRAL